MRTITMLMTACDRVSIGRNQPEHQSMPDRRSSSGSNPANKNNQLSSLLRQSY